MKGQKGQCLPYDKVPKLFLYICYFLFRIAVDRITFPSTEPMTDQNVFRIAKTQKLCIRFLFSISMSGDSSSHFLEMIMLFGSIGSMTQTTIMVGKKTYPGLGLNVSSLLQYVQYWGLCHWDDLRLTGPSWARY